MGYLLSERGIGPNDSKVEAVRTTRSPETSIEVRSFLGLVNFPARFIPDLSTTSEPLRQLTRKGENFKWEEIHENAFNKLKSQLVSAQSLAYFDKDARTMVIADASPVGLVAVLVQEQNGEERVISYASRSLTSVERRYSLTEKEALGLVCACERFHAYLYRKHFELITDHKPLEIIYSKNSSRPARMQKWFLWLQAYDFTVKYRPETENIADELSRLLRDTVQSTNDAEDYIRFVAKNTVLRAIIIQEVEEESVNDPELSVVRTCILTDSQWDLVDVSFRSVRQELSVLEKLEIRGTWLVIPKSLRKKVLSLAHEGHQGIVKTKQRFRSKVWWPNIDKEGERKCRTCHGCQQLLSRPQPMVRRWFSEGSWEILACDLLGPVDGNIYILAVIDYYSRWIEIDILRTVTSIKVIAVLERMFLTHGLPYEIISDNGPRVVSSQFEEFCGRNGICHKRLTILLQFSPPIGFTTNLCFFILPSLSAEAVACKC